MRVLIAPAGTRGDFQPMLALAIGLARAGHEPTIAASALYAPEAAAFGIPFVTAGIDVRGISREWAKSGDFTPARSVVKLLRAGREYVAAGIEELAPLVRGYELVVCGGAQICAPSAAEAAGVPCWYVAYISQALPSAHHPPFTMPVRGRPGLVNRALWALNDRVIAAAFGTPLGAARRRLGLPPIDGIAAHFFGASHALLASDPEIDPVAPDVRMAHPSFGSFHLPDVRPLPADLLAFVQEGPRPVYIGFGSVSDGRPRETTALILEGVERAGVRAVISRGWSELDSPRASSRVHFVDDVSHGLLLPLVAATVHHGGAGTTAASARAGRPQLVVHHAFDQIRIGERIHAAGLGPAPIARSKLDAKGLAAALRVLVRDEALRERAARVGAKITVRDAVGDAVRFLETRGHR